MWKKYKFYVNVEFTAHIFSSIMTHITIFSYKSLSIFLVQYKSWESYSFHPHTRCGCFQKCRKFNGLLLLK